MSSAPPASPGGGDTKVALCFKWWDEVRHCLQFCAPADALLTHCAVLCVCVGNGSSITAVKNGLSVDTTMGLTQLVWGVSGDFCTQGGASVCM